MGDIVLADIRIAFNCDASAMLSTLRATRDLNFVVCADATDINIIPACVVAVLTIAIAVERNVNARTTDLLEAPVP